MPRKSKNVPIDAIQELADKAPQSASIGGTEDISSKIKIDVDSVLKTKVHFAVPCYGGMLTESTFLSFIKFSNLARKIGLEWSLETLVNESLISRGRNTLVSKFLTLKDSTHLMFIDSDIGWEDWNVLLLLNHQVDVIGGLYPLKGLPLKWVVNSFKGSEQHGDLQEVSKAGTGFLCIKKEVFEKLKSHPRVVPYKNDVGLDKNLDAHMRTYFDTMVKDERYFSEDWTFCENWREMGGKVWVDRRVILKHIGNFSYSMENNDSLYHSYGKMYAEYNNLAKTS